MEGKTIDKELKVNNFAYVKSAELPSKALLGEIGAVDIESC